MIAKMTSRKKLFVGSLCLGCALFALTTPSPPLQAKMHVVERSSDTKMDTVRVAQGTSENMKLDQTFADIVVGDPDIADVVPLTDRSLYILGKKLGRTSVSIYSAEKQLLGSLDVEVSYDTSALAVELHKRLPDAKIKVSSINGRILLTGTVPDAVTLDQAVLIAKQFGADIVPSITVTRSQQVMLEVRFLEVSRTAGRELSSRLSVAGPGWSSTTGFASLKNGSAPFGTISGTLISGAYTATLDIRALEEKGLARRLAEPNLVALSGDTASFLAGGEFPFPIQSGIAGQVSIEFKKFGVGLSFTPTVLKDSLINMKIEPEVSELDNTQSVSIGGVTVPSLIVRRASTTVELKDGQSFALAGLLQSVNASDLSQLPWIGNIPILGALFRSASFQRHETDLVILITPHIIQPVVPGQVLRAPTAITKRANDAELFLAGQTDTPRRGFLNDADRAEQQNAQNAPAQPYPAQPYNDGGHILSLAKPEDTNARR
jgi:pilus assembly protein CpaC